MAVAAQHPALKRCDGDGNPVSRCAELGVGDCGPCQTCSYTYSDDVQNLEYDGITGANFADFKTNMDAAGYTVNEIEICSPALINTPLIPSSYTANNNYPGSPIDNVFSGAVTDYTETFSPDLASSYLSLHGSPYEEPIFDFTWDSPTWMDQIIVWSGNGPWGGGDNGLHSFELDLYKGGSLVSSQGPFNHPQDSNTAHTYSFPITEVDRVVMRVLAGWIDGGGNTADDAPSGVYNMNIEEIRFNLSQVPPVVPCVSRFEIFHCGDPKPLMIDGNEITPTCVAGVRPTSPCPTYTHIWQEGDTDCQKFVIDSLQGVAPLTVEINGNTITSLPYEVDQPRNGSAAVTITDGNGCSVSNVHANVKALDEPLWTQPTIPANVTAPDVGAINAGNTGTPSQHITLQESASKAGSELNQTLTTELNRKRRGSQADPQLTWVNAGFSGTDGTDPANHAPLMFTDQLACDPQIQVDVETQRIGGTSGEEVTVWWYDAAGNYIPGADQVLHTLTGAQAKTLHPYTLTPPVGAEGLVVQHAGWSAANTHWSYFFVDAATGETVVKVV